MKIFDSYRRINIKIKILKNRIKKKNLTTKRQTDGRKYCIDKPNKIR